MRTSSVSKQGFNGIWRSDKGLKQRSMSIQIRRTVSLVTVQDTIYQGPPKADHPLLNLSVEASNRLLLTPHVAGVTVGALRRMMGVAFENMKRAAHGKPINNVVNGINWRQKQKGE